MLFEMLSVLILCTARVHGEHDLIKEYRFQRVLDREESYVLYWSFDLEAGTIAFAVNVSTTGWVGFGLSPNGQMPLSDVVIGWVDDEGQPKLKDRFAAGRFEPEIDTVQDWFLTGHSREHDGRTILEFKRALVTCDRDFDIAITTDTSRIIWSYGAKDPEGTTGLERHVAQGSFSINLLGGLNQDRSTSESEESYFEIRNSNLEVPVDTTTYWCTLIELPAHIVNNSLEHYVYKMSPILTPHDRDYVHHLVVFLCPVVNSTGYSGLCKNPPGDITTCINTKILGSWAVGGRDFIFPNDVGFPVGTDKNEYAVVLEVHFDNPDSTPGILDSSGMRFYYTATPPKHRAGIMTLGHHITSQMIVPPTTEGYTTSGICASSCTSEHFPSDGITVFGNIFHTHLIGTSVKLRHYTPHDEDCDGWKELEPIDQNLHYDFNYQQYNILTKEKRVMPGDVMDLECVYKSSRDSVTLGGLSTTEEMCLSFVVYYPKLDLSICVSRPSLSSFRHFTDQYTNGSKSQEIIEHLIRDDHNNIAEDFNKIAWSPVALRDFESSVRSGNLTQLCVVDIDSPGSFRIDLEEVPLVSCPYQPPPQQCLSLDASSQIKSASASALSTLMLVFLATKIF